MTRPNITPGPWSRNPSTNTVYAETPSGNLTVSCMHHSDDATSIVIAAVPDLLTALESALESLQEARVPLYNHGADGAAECCEESAALIKEALTKAGYTFP